MRFIGTEQHVHAGVGRPAVLLLNLGTPQAPTAPAVRRYLREFLSDPRVVELPRWLWWPILNGPVLALPPSRLADAGGAAAGSGGFGHDGRLVHRCRDPGGEPAARRSGDPLDQAFRRRSGLY